MKLGRWQLVDGGCGMTRVRLGGNVENIADRYAFIEKTPRIRIRDAHLVAKDQDYLNWAQGPFKGDGPEDRESMEWCDIVLVAFGFELEY